MHMRDVALVAFGAAIGVLAALLVPRDVVPVESDAAPGAETAAFQQRIAELERQVASRPPALAARPAADSAAPGMTEPGGAVDEGRSDAGDDDDRSPPAPPTVEEGVYAVINRDRVKFGPDLNAMVYVKAGGRAVVRAVVLTRAPTATEIADWLQSTNAEDFQKGLAGVHRTQDKSFLPTLTELVNRAENRERAQSIINTITPLKGKAWSPVQATGAPDTPIDGDLGTAWASKQPEMGLVTLDLSYRDSVRVDAVRVHETLAPGAIARIDAKMPDGTWEAIWTGTAPRAESPAWFEPPVRATGYATREIRLVVDTDRVTGWNEIDAVELVGDGLRQWASSAVASSSYSD